MQKKRLLAAIAFLLTLSASANVRWLEKEYDFGLMKEVLGPQRGSVRFVNDGKEEIVITGARPSCGCTSVVYPTDPIAPGDTVSIEFTYNPEGRPGRFEKTIRVYINDFDANIIKITGNVLGTPESLAVFYPIETGPLRLTDDRLTANDMTYGEGRHFFVNGYNQTLDTIRPQVISKNPAVSVDVSSRALGPGDIVSFSIYFNSKKISEPGPVTLPLEVIADASDPDSERHEIIIKADLKPDFRGMTLEQEKKAPRCYLLPEKIDLGEISGKKKAIEFSFAVSNQGETPLHLLRVRSKSGSVKVTKFPTAVKPGKTGKVTAVLSASELPEGPFRTDIDVYTDDPLHPVRKLSVAGLK